MAQVKLKATQLDVVEIAPIMAADPGLIITESQISDLQAYLLDITGEPINDLSNVTITGPVADDELLAWDSGTSMWINQTATEANLYTITELDGAAGSAGAKINKVTPAVDGAIPTLTAAGELIDGGIKLTRINGIQPLTGPGVSDPDFKVTAVTSTGVGDSVTLTSVGIMGGHEKHIMYVAEGAGTDTVIVTTPDGPTTFLHVDSPATGTNTRTAISTITLNAPGDFVIFEWTFGTWVIKAYSGTLP